MDSVRIQRVEDIGAGFDHTGGKRRLEVTFQVLDDDGEVLTGAYLAVTMTRKDVSLPMGYAIHSCGDDAFSLLYRPRFDMDDGKEEVAVDSAETVVATIRAFAQKVRENAGVLKAYAEIRRVAVACGLTVQIRTESGDARNSEVELAPVRESFGRFDAQPSGASRIEIERTPEALTTFAASIPAIAGAVKSKVAETKRTLQLLVALDEKLSGFGFKFRDSLAWGRADGYPGFRPIVIKAVDGEADPVTLPSMTLDELSAFIESLTAEKLWSLAIKRPLGSEAEAAEVLAKREADRKKAEKESAKKKAKTNRLFGETVAGIEAIVTKEA